MPGEQVCPNNMDCCLQVLRWVVTSKLQRTNFDLTCLSSTTHNIAVPFVNLKEIINGTALDTPGTQTFSVWLCTCKCITLRQRLRWNFSLSRKVWKFTLKFEKFCIRKKLSRRLRAADSKTELIKNHQYIPKWGLQNKTLRTSLTIENRLDVSNCYTTLKVEELVWILE